MQSSARRACLLSVILASVVTACTDGNADFGESRRDSDFDLVEDAGLPTLSAGRAAEIDCGAELLALFDSLDDAIDRGDDELDYSRLQTFFEVICDRPKSLCRVNVLAYLTSISSYLKDDRQLCKDIVEHFGLFARSDPDIAVRVAALRLIKAYAWSGSEAARSVALAASASDDLGVMSAASEALSRFPDPDEEVAGVLRESYNRGVESRARPVIVAMLESLESIASHASLAVSALESAMREDGEMKLPPEMLVRTAVTLARIDIDNSVAFKVSRDVVASEQVDLGELVLVSISSGSSRAFSDDGAARLLQVAQQSGSETLRAIAAEVVRERFPAGFPELKE